MICPQVNKEVLDGLQDIVPNPLANLLKLGPCACDLVPEVSQERLKVIGP